MKKALLCLQIFILAKNVLLSQNNSSYKDNNSVIKGINNVAFGAASQFQNDPLSHDNTSVGYLALSSNKTGNNNIAIGCRSLFINNDGEYNVANGYQALNSNQSGKNNIAIGYNAGYYETSSNKLYIAADSNKTILYGDMGTGQVLIGKPQPNGYVFKGNRKLNVIGGILTDSIRVALSSNWADYVFDAGYKLKTLDELETYIQVNKHLPNIPSSNEVAQYGIDLASINSKLLEKIEELHLYILKLKKGYDYLEKSNNRLEEKNNLLEKRIIELELKK